MAAPDILRQILDARNPYRDIAQQRQASLDRRRPQAAPSGQSQEDRRQTEPTEGTAQSRRQGSSPDGLDRQDSDIYARIQDNIQQSQQLQKERRSSQQENRLRDMMSRVRSQNSDRMNNQLRDTRVEDRLQDLPVGERVTGANGQLDTSQLADADGNGNLLQPDAAASWRRMVADAAQDGVQLTIGNSYRDLATQHRLAQEKGLYSQGGLAAEPGTSNHGLGVAVDVGEGAQRQWLAENAGRYGWSTIPREPWHWEYKG